MEQEPRQRLTRERIVTKALEIIDRDGLPGLSMRRLGSELCVEGMALYRYYPEKEVILDRVVDLVLGDLHYADTPGGWQAGLRQIAHAVRDQLLSHPNAMPLVAARWHTAAKLEQVLAHAVDEMKCLDVEPEDALAVVRAVMSYVLGYCWIEVGAFVGEMPEKGGLIRKPVSMKDSAASTKPTDLGPVQFAKGLDFILVGTGTSLAAHSGRTSKAPSA